MRGLKEFKVLDVFPLEGFGDPNQRDAAELQCPRPGCAGKFIVERGKFKSNEQLANKSVTTRPCPYCFRVSLIPTQVTPADAL